ncbi:MAG: pullulanase, partial [Bifidobacterium sp.]|nr:pullulanase [Bifidobacterium sp.]
AFTDLGTTVDGKGEFPTGVDYFKQLGVTAIQLLPFYDYGSVDENDPRQYNWGYDPLNYNVPEGSYSTNPFDGTVRITECKQMIQSLHAQGFKVIMDVVYNHMYTADNWFERVVSGYFVRRNADGTLSNGSGCGDDMASERAMMRRYIVDSVTYWAREYHIDGFRFDLMGLIDTDTMNAVRASLDALPGGKDLIMYGEPWAAGPSSTLPGTELANKEGLHLLDSRIGHFCDRTRDAIKGHVFERRIKGYVNGNAHDTKPQIELAVDAWRAPETNEGNAGQIIQYVSAHDDWTLWDKLCLSMIGDDSPESANKAESGHADDSHRTLESRDDALEHAYRAMPGTQTRKVLEANALAAGLIYTAAGIPFMLAGEEFGKTKFGNDNSFDSGVKVNELDWARAERMQGLVDYYRRLIAVRRANPGLFDAEHIAVEAPGNAVAYRSDDIAVLVNPDDEEYSLPVERIDSAFADSLHDDLPATPESASHAEARWVCVLDSSGTSTGEFRQTGIRIAGGGFPMPARTLSIWKRER